MKEKHLLVINDNGTVTVYHADANEVKPLYAEGEVVTYRGAQARIVACKIGTIPGGLCAPFYVLVKLGDEFKASVVKVIEANLLEENPRLHDNIIDLIPGPQRPRPSQGYINAKDELDKRMRNNGGWIPPALRRELAPKIEPQPEPGLDAWSKFLAGLDMSALEDESDED